MDEYEFDASELSNKAFSHFRMFLKKVEYSRAKYFPEVSSDREESVIVSEFRLPKGVRLLICEGQQFKPRELNKFILRDYGIYNQANYIASDYASPLTTDYSMPFLPKSVTLRHSRRTCNLLFERFGMADVIALDRLMIQIEWLLKSGKYPGGPDMMIYLPFVLSYIFRCRFCAISWQREDYLYRRGLLEGYIEGMSDGVSACEVEDAFNVVVAAVLHLLAFVFQYLVGCVDRGGSKTYSSGSFDFRATFVSLVLFQGAYVWIKFRQAAPVSRGKRKAPDAPRKGYIYSRASKASTRYEPRFALLKEEIEEGEGINRLPLGGYATYIEAEIVLQFVEFYYGPNGKDGGIGELENSQFLFPIPPMSEEDAGRKKRTWVPDKVKKLVEQTYKDFQEQQLGMGIQIGHGHVAGSSDPSPSPVPVTYSSPVREPSNGTVGGSLDDLSGWEEIYVSNLPPQPTSLVGQQAEARSLLQDKSVTQGTKHGEEPPWSPIIEIQQATEIRGHGHNVGSSAPSPCVLPITFPSPPTMIARELGIVTQAPPCSGLLSLPPCDGTVGGPFDVLHGLNKGSGLIDSDLFNLSPQEFNLVDYQGALSVTQGLEHDQAPRFSPSFKIQQGSNPVDAVAEKMDAGGSGLSLQQKNSVLQEMLDSQIKEMKNRATQYVEWDSQKKQFQIQISLLQQENQRLKQENQRLHQETEGRLKLEQVAKSQVAFWNRIIIDLQQRNPSV